MNPRLPMERMPLTERQKRIAKLVSEGLKNSEVAEAMGTTENVIKNDLRIIFDKCGVWNRVELALWVVRQEKA